MNTNTITLRRGLKVIAEKGQNQLPGKYMATALKNLEDLGFTFSLDLMDVLNTLSVEEFTTFYKSIVKDLKEMVGAHKEFNPMYPNFPRQVMEMEEGELYLNAIIHYLGSFVRDVTGIDVTDASLPKYEKEERFPMLDNVELKVIDLGSAGDFYQTMKRLISAKSSISETDKQDVDWAIANCNLSDILPGEIPVKENLAFTVSSMLKHGKIDANQISPYFNTATDVLRLMVALSDGDVSLAKPTIFNDFKRRERRLFLSLLEKSSGIEENMLRYKNVWKTLNRVLHPGEYKTKYKKTFEAFDVIVNDKPFQTFGGRLENALLIKDAGTAIKLLKTRPGEFARRLDHLLRIGNPQVVVANFASVVDDVSNPVLMQVMAHFKHRNEPSDIRTFFPKGNVANVFAIDNNLPILEQGISSRIVGICEDSFIRRYSEMPSLGKVYVDPQLKSYNVPFAQRSASKALRTLTRGTKLDMPSAETIRTFIWWHDLEDGDEWNRRVDVDLSSVFYDEEWNFLEELSFRELRTSGAVHSGDITSAPEGACEFIDMTVPILRENGVRYVVMSVNSYSEIEFCNLPECFAGWMAVEDPEAGEIFEPSRVQNKIDLASDTNISIPVVFDLVEGKVVWCDLALKNEPNLANAVTEHKGGLALMGKSMIDLKKPNLYDLFYLHAVSRGELTDDISEADTIFSTDKGTTPFDVEEIMSEYI